MATSATPCGPRASRPRLRPNIRAALQLQPDFAEVHVSLGQVLREAGRYDEALGHFRRGHDLGSRRPSWHYPSARWIREVEVDARLAAVLRGDDRPVDARELMSLARMATHQKRRFAATAKLLARSLEAHAEWADYSEDPPRYYAAACAAVAATDPAGDAEALGEAERPLWRTRALGWLRAELATTARSPVRLRPG